MKTWIIRDTGKKRNPQNGDWYLMQGIPVKNDGEYLLSKYPILSIEKMDYDPLEPIRDVYERYKDRGPLTVLPQEELWDAIKKAMGK